jgi:hypothetical protein
LLGEIDTIRARRHGGNSCCCFLLWRGQPQCFSRQRDGYAIKFLGFNAPDDGDEGWENELDKVLKNQESTYVEFDEDDEGCVWNIKVDWANYDESVLWKNVNLCKFNVLRLRYDPGTKTTSFVAE